jgi:serine/threonine protein kinase
LFVPSPSRGRKVALEVAIGLHYLHSLRIVHFDLKSLNVLLKRDGTAKIADVGLAQIMRGNDIPRCAAGRGGGMSRWAGRQTDRKTRAGPDPLKRYPADGGWSYLACRIGHWYLFGSQ